jgi:hypothetical protein
MLASTADRGLTRAPWAALAPVQRRSRRWVGKAEEKIAQPIDPLCKGIGL